MIRNKQKAFTLAEVLITVGIIGVIAALSAPALIQHSASAKVGPAFSRCISTLTNGFQAYMYANEADTVSSADPTIQKNGPAIFQRLADEHIKMKKDISTTKPYIYDKVGGSSVIDPSAFEMFALSDRSTLVVPTADCDISTVDRCKFYFLPLGWTGKDIIALGEDVFEVAYTNKGDIQVYGLDYSDTGDLWDETCGDDDIKTFTPATAKGSCGGRIVAKGFKKDY